mgnify:CR=1 FL=1
MPELDGFALVLEGHTLATFCHNTESLRARSAGLFQWVGVRLDSRIFLIGEVPNGTEEVRVEGTLAEISDPTRSTDYSVFAIAIDAIPATLTSVDVELLTPSARSIPEGYVFMIGRDDGAIGRVFELGKSDRGRASP